LLLLAILFPFAIYCLILSVLNRRPHPVPVSGTWDFVGILFAASGILFVGGPAVLSGFFSERWRAFWWTGGHEGLGLDTVQLWTTLALGYFVLVVGSAAWLLWRRRAVTCVYNVTPEILDRVLIQALEAVGLTWSRTGNRVFLTVPRGTSGQPERPGKDAASAQMSQVTAEKDAGEPAVTLPQPRSVAPRYPSSDLLSTTAVLDVEPFPVMRHVSLRWQLVDPPLRQEVEGALGRLLARTPAPDNPLGGFFLALGALSFLFMLGTVGFLLIWLILTAGR
jgi:hypothetical protein